MLENGKHCEDCIHIKRCSWLLGRIGNENYCDWIPTKFQITSLTDGDGK